MEGLSRWEGLPRLQKDMSPSSPGLGWGYGQGLQTAEQCHRQGFRQRRPKSCFWEQPSQVPKASGWAGNPKGEDVFLETYLLPVPSSSPSWASCLAWSPREAISFLSSAVADSSASHIQVHGDPGVPGRLFPGSVGDAVTGTWWWGSFAPRRIPESKLRHWSKASIKAGPWVW